MQFGNASTIGSGRNAMLTFDVNPYSADVGVGGQVLAHPKLSTSQARALVVLHEMAHATGALPGNHSGNFNGWKIQGSVLDAYQANYAISKVCFGGE